jgi:hypothetical protein
MDSIMASHPIPRRRPIQMKSSVEYGVSNACSVSNP